ncbi:hypothetical protein DL771_009516 [Monosporascus sp. 5C6A]|nr:hypothetical protein DL771_009516 [Monosporascus sp. 5C6A]
MIQFAAALGIASCPGGPTISFKAGRVDSTTANPPGQLPGPNDDAASMVSAFEAKGFTAAQLVALVGAHTTAKKRNGEALDSTPGAWDTNFYTETADGSVAGSFNSDVSLSNSTETSSTWGSFGADAAAWAAAFVPAMEKLSLMGNDEASLADCSSVITNAIRN